MRVPNDYWVTAGHNAPPRIAEPNLFKTFIYPCGHPTEKTTSSTYVNILSRLATRDENIREKMTTNEHDKEVPNDNFARDRLTIRSALCEVSRVRKGSHTEKVGIDGNPARCDVAENNTKVCWE